MIYLVTLVDRATRCLVSWEVVTQRTLETMQPLVDAVWQHSPHPPQRRLFTSDQLDTYRTLV